MRICTGGLTRPCNALTPVQYIAVHRVSRSKQCQPRRTVEACDLPITCARWSLDGESLVFASGDTVYLVAVNPPASALLNSGLSKTTARRQWKAHQGAVLALDCTASHILSGGEDGRYKLWHFDGTLLFRGAAPPRVSERATANASGSALSEVTSVRWRPGGGIFAVAGHDWIALCDKSGRMLSQNFGDFGKPNFAGH